MWTASDPDALQFLLVERQQITQQRLRIGRQFLDLVQAFLNGSRFPKGARECAFRVLGVRTELQSSLSDIPSSLCSVVVTDGARDLPLAVLVPPHVRELERAADVRAVFLVAETVRRYFGPAGVAANHVRSLVKTLKRQTEKELRGTLHRLSSEEAAVLALLQQRMEQELNADRRPRAKKRAMAVRKQ